MYRGSKKQMTRRFPALVVVGALAAGGAVAAVGAVGASTHDEHASRAATANAHGPLGHPAEASFRPGFASDGGAL
jgi:hypothetical protein